MTDYSPFPVGVSLTSIATNPASSSEDDEKEGGMLGGLFGGGKKEVVPLTPEQVIFYSILYEQQFCQRSVGNSIVPGVIFLSLLYSYGGDLIFIVINLFLLDGGKPAQEAAEAEAMAWSKSTTVFKSWSRLDSKKLIAFHHDHDIACGMFYAEPAEGEESLLPASTPKVVMKRKERGDEKDVGMRGDEGW
jgi:hypothetical protein